MVLDGMRYIPDFFAFSWYIYKQICACIILIVASFFFPLLALPAGKKQQKIKTKKLKEKKKNY